MNRETIGEHFRVLHLLGSGGFGAVHRARDTALERDVALKVLSGVNASDPIARARFDREAKLLSQLNHPHIVSVFNYGIETDGVAYIAMQLLEGKSLRAVIREEGAMEPIRAARVIKQVADAVGYAHKHEVIHRDLKPDNIMLLPAPEADYVKVLDFGLSAFSFGLQFDIQKLTQTGEIVGTATYMAPEMCLGGRATVATDIYALGCVLHECLSGEAPFTADDPVQLLAKHLGGDPTTLPAAVPTNLALVVRKAMQRDPADRFASMDAFSEALDAVIKGQALSISERDFKQTPGAKKNRMPKWLIPSLVGAVAAVAFVGSVNKPTHDTQQMDLEWRLAMSEADAALMRKFPIEVADSYEHAATLARTSRQKFLSKLAVGKLSSVRGPLSDDDVARDAQNTLKEAVTLTNDPRERNFAKMLWGTCAAFAYDYDTAWEALKDQPWTDAVPPPEDGAYLSRFGLIRDWAKLSYAGALAHGPEQSYNKAYDFLNSQRPPENNGYGIKTSWGCELMQYMIHSNRVSAEAKEQAKEWLRAAYREFADLVGARYQVRIIREVLGDKEVERLYAQRQARSKT